MFLVFFFSPPHCCTCQSHWNSVTLWRLHLPNNGGRYATASRNGRVSTCLSAGSCLNWCSIRRAISEVCARSYLWNNTVCRASTPNSLWHQEKMCVPHPTPEHTCTYAGVWTKQTHLHWLQSQCVASQSVMKLLCLVNFIYWVYLECFCGHLYFYVSVKLLICLIQTVIPGFNVCGNLLYSIYRSLVILLFPQDDVNAIKEWRSGRAMFNNVL